MGKREDFTIAPQDSDTAVFDDINGNWEAVSQFLSEHGPIATRDPESLNKIIETNARNAQIALFGGPVLLPEAEQGRGMVSAPTRGGTVARAFWWGFHIEISHEDVLQTITAVDGLNIIVAMLQNEVPPVVRPFLAVAKVFLDTSKAVLQALDRGRGVYISMSWFAPGIFVPTSVM
jgi:hypothetical protein